ncbi:MAG: carboxypeptidase-like regulatory domain-containing protein [Thermoguttaceae bacterium]
MILSLTVLLATAITACKPTRPKGCPKLYPCTIRIVQDGSPLEGATVALFSDDPEIAKWPINSRTDANGEVKLMTQTFPGAPLGTYKVTISKQETIDIGNPLEGILPRVTQRVDAQFLSKDQTPATVEVVKGMTEPVEINVGAAN